jgi:hypothetical protein
MSELSVEDFRTVAGEGFSVAGSDGVTLVLAEVQGLGRAFAEREAFVLTFEGPEEPRLGQGTYRLEHERLGAQEVFVVPVAQAEDGRLRYEANFT